MPNPIHMPNFKGHTRDLRASLAAAVRLAVICLILPAVPAIAQEPARPNIVIIISDDAGYTDFGFTNHTEGINAVPTAPTPNIDRIATEGVRFDRGYVTASVCSPSRAGLLTGRYQQRFGHECNLGGDNPQDPPGTPAKETMIPEMLKPIGYQTAAFGKWHLGRAPGMRPTDQGFDHFEGLVGGSRSYFPVDSKGKPQGLVDGTEWIDEPADLYITDWIGHKAAHYIDERAHEDSPPFFAYIAFTAPHTPMDALPEDLEAARRTLPEGTPELRITYTAMTIALDRAVGGILDAIDRAPRETLVFFINDNGGATNNGSNNGPYRGMKGSKWEGGIRVPFALRWPGTIEPGRVYAHAVSSLDIAATIAGTIPTAAHDTGAHSPAGASPDPDRPLDGVDLRPFLTGEAGGPPHRALFWRRDVAAAVQMGDWKLIRSEGNPSLLFDLAADPGECHDLSSVYPERAGSLLDALTQWESEMIAPRWLEGERWQRNQIRKHRMDTIGREAERRFP